MGTKQAFKTYERGQRIQDTTVSFASGMSFTNTPLEEGFVKLLVNYDFGENGETLKPRKGLHTIKAYTDYPDSVDPLGFNENGMSIVAGNKHSYNGRTYYQIIIGVITDVDAPQPNRYYGDAWVLTCRKSFEDDKVDLVDYVQLNDNTLSQYCIFVKPNNSESNSIHNMSLVESEYVKQHVGTFAFNGGYYYFCNDGSLHYTYFNEDLKKFDIATITAYKPYQSETQNSLYNMLLEEPYTFENQQVGTILKLTGFMPCEHIKNNTDPTKTGATVLHPQNGLTYDYKLFYNYPGNADTNYCFHIEYNTGNSDVWYSITRDETAAFSLGPAPIIFQGIRVDSSFAQFRIYAVAQEHATFTDSSQLSLDSLANAVILIASFNYAGASKLDSTLNTGLVRYNLSYTAGMTYWKNRIWLFGAKDRESGKQDNTILFASDVNRPDWFPYTANADIFDEEIICLQPMLDDLLVFTSHNLYSITIDADGLSWTRKHLQSKLNLAPWDLNFIQIVKNMVFFKSGNYFYMVVPKLTAASGAGLAIAPVSKNITYFLDNFETNVKQIVDDLYNYSSVNRFGDRSKITFDLKLIHYYNYLDYEDVHNCYVFEATKKEKIRYSNSTKLYDTEDTKVYFNFELLYNTVSRTWRIYTLESQRVIQPLFMDATGESIYATLLNYKDNVAVQLLKYSDTSTIDLYIKQGDNAVSQPNIFSNWQYLDTGLLNQNTDMKKRFREYQFKISNNSNNFLQFYSGFILDKSVRTYEILYQYTEIDTETEGISTLVVDAQPKEGIQGAPSIQSSSVIVDSVSYNYTTLGSWKLGISKFPETNIWKIRVPTSGKGYLPRVILISYNQADYELISCATVYRQLYSR